jgi:hypothetical protein
MTEVMIHHTNNAICKFLALIMVVMDRLMKTHIHPKYSDAAITQLTYHYLSEEPVL